MAPVKILFVLSLIETYLSKQYGGYSLISARLLLTSALFFAFQVSAWLTWSCFIYPRFLSPLRSVPGPSGGNIFLGHRLMLMKEPNGQLFRTWQQEIPNDGILRYLDVFNTETIVPVSSKALAEVLVQKTYEFIKPPQLVAGLGQILGVGVFLAEGEEHKKQRRDLSPAFAFRPVKELYPIFWSKSSEFVQALVAHNASAEQANECHPPINVSNWASRATLDIIGEAGMGQQFNSIKDPTNELIKTYNKIFSLSRTSQVLGILGIFLPRWLIASLPIKRNDDIHAASQVIKRTCYDLIERARQDSTQKGGGATNILSIAIESGGFSDEGLVNQLMTFLVAGHETTASALTFAICMLCAHPGMQHRLRAEVRSALPDPRSPNSSISSTTIDNLAYLNAFCNEVLRLYSPVPLTVRVAAQDTSILGHFIPKGTSISIAPWATNGNRELWGDDAEEFNPDRWIGAGKANTGGARSNYAFMTFLQGPRSCIGQSFAKGEFACLVAAWVGAFETTFARENFEVKVANGFTPRPKDFEVRLKVLEEW